MALTSCGDPPYQLPIFWREPPCVDPEGCKPKPVVYADETLGPDHGSTWVGPEPEEPDDFAAWEDEGEEDPWDAPPEE